MKIKDRHKINIQFLMQSEFNNLIVRPLSFRFLQIFKNRSYYQLKFVTLKKLKLYTNIENN